MKVQSKKDFPYVVETNNDGQKVEKVIDFIIPHSQIDSQWKYAVCVNKNDWDIEDNLDETQKSYPIISFEEWKSLPDEKIQESDFNAGINEVFETKCGKKFNSKQIIGYKLIKPEYWECVSIIAGFIFDDVEAKEKNKNFVIDFMKSDTEGYSSNLEKAGVLSLWFQTVYDNSITLKSGVKLSEDDIAEVKEILNNK